MRKLVLCLVALLAVLGHSVAVRTESLAKRPVSVILAELHAEQISEESSYGPPPASSASGSAGVLPSSESSSAESSAGVSGADMKSASEGSESTIPAASAGAGSESSSASSSSGTRDFSSSSMAPPPPLGADPVASMGSSSSSSSSSADSISSSSASSSGSSFDQPMHKPAVPKFHRKGKKRLPETNVIGEAPHTELNNDEVDIIARMVLKHARKARCAKEDEYCRIQFDACRGNEVCRRQVEDQASLNPHERAEINRLLKN